VLGLGEREAIALAEELDADALLVDDEAARIEAQRRHIPIQGTLGILDLAAEHGLIDMPDAIQRLLQTNFRASKKLVDFFLARDVRRRKRETGIGE
jgi:predicted nucleic acid-binding protein